MDSFAGFAGGVSLLVAGPAGTGKSTLLGSAAKLAPTYLLATKPRELNSWAYTTNGVTRENGRAELFFDHLWRPTLGSYKADGFGRLLKRIWSLYEDPTVRIVLLDPITDVVSLAAHSMLSIENAAAPRDMNDPQSFYGALKYKLKEFTQALTALQYADVPKHVLATVHTQPAKEDQPATKNRPARVSSDKIAKGVEFEGDVLPMIEGGYRREIASEFDAMLFSGVRYDWVETKANGKVSRVQKPIYFVQVQPNAERHSKVAIAPLLGGRELPNDFEVFIRAVQEAREGVK